MFKKFLAEESGASMLEYIIGGALALGILGVAVWALMGAVADKGDTATTAVTGATIPGLSGP